MLFHTKLIILIEITNILIGFVLSVLDSLCQEARLIKYNIIKDFLNKNGLIKIEFQY